MADDEQPPESEADFKYARAIHAMARLLTRDDSAPAVRAEMVRIIGETLDVDRMLIYDIRFQDEVAEGLCEWLNPAAEGIQPTVATYPLAVFAGGAEHVRRTRSWMESHIDDVHAALVDDGSGEILHGAMQIQSLCWYPFDIEDARFFVLVFNQVRRKRRWSKSELSFVEDLAELVSLYHARLRLAAHDREMHKLSERQTRLEGLGLLAGGVAHDFNNLLTVIMGNTSIMLTKPEIAEPGSRYLQAIDRAAANAAGMCQQLLNYSGRSKSTLVDLDLGVLVLEASTLVASSVSERLRLELVDEEVRVRGDRTRLQQVIVNLLTNASDALVEAGTITLRCGALSREGLAEKLDDRPTEWTGTLFPYLEVEDTGVGMDPVTRKRLLEPFFTTKGAGHGLGLAGVRGVLDTHGAALGIRSEQGSGSSFVVVFPSEEDSARARQAEIAASERAASEVAAPMVLVVDAAPVVRRVCESSLMLAGYRVLTATAGEEALTVCAQHRSEICAVLLSADLPGIDGLQTLQAFRKGGFEFPVVLTGDESYGVGLPESRSVDWTFLQKPFQPQQLVSAVAGVLERGAGEADGA